MYEKNRLADQTLVKELRFLLDKYKKEAGK